MGVVFKVSGADTGGAFAVVEHPIEPGRLVLPHVHRHEDEYSYVLEGTIGARVGDHQVVGGPGSYLFKPRGLMHTFWNAGPGPARILEVIAPVRGDLFLGLGRRAGLQVQPEVTRSMTETCALLQAAIMPDETKPEMRGPNDAEVMRLDLARGQPLTKE
jgi:quercetin dioxygenase-like cupin family protein